MGEYSLGIYVPSYKRSKTCTCHEHIPFCTYVVRKSEEESYKSAGIKSIWAIEDDLIDNVVKVNQYLIDNAPEDVICILDDDIRHFVYRLDTTEEILDGEVVMAEIERIAQLMMDLDIGYAAVDATTVPYNYTQEFDWKGSSGSMRWVNRHKVKAKGDESVIYNWDIDFILQELLVNRIVLKPKYFVSQGFADVNAGGLSNKKRADQLTSITLMKNKWGKYFDYDIKSNKPFVRVKR